MILITGAAGKTGQAVIRTLVEKRSAVRVLVYRSEQIPTVKALGAQDVIVGDMRAQEFMNRAVQGVRSIYHICPNVNPDEMAIGQIAINAALSAGVERFIYHSVLHPQTERMPHHWYKLRVEEALFESGLSYTVLQPAVYMQNMLAHWEKITKAGIYPVPYSADTRLSLVDLQDVIQAAAIVLTETGHTGATYELVGTNALSQNDIAAILSEVLDRPVEVEVMPHDNWKREALSTGLDNYQVSTLIKMFNYYDQYGFSGNPNVLAWLLGREPTSLAKFAARVFLQ